MNDFKFHVDATFGNCHTFNVDRNNSLISSGAGPTNGNIFHSISLKMMAEHDYFEM